MRSSWFVRKGWLFVPSHAVGRVILICCICVVVRSFFIIDAHSHSASDTLMNVAFRALLVGLVYTLLAAVISLILARFR